MKKDKVILDACCSGRMMWFNKNHPNAYYADIRTLEEEKLSNGQYFKIAPDFLMDFRKMEFPDKRFKLVVFDPPHFTSPNNTSWLAKKYGTLDKETWKIDIKKGFDECWRVLEDYGVLIFKWSVEANPSKTRTITITQLLEVIGKEPLFGHPTGKIGNTFWMTFMKIPKK